MTKVCRLCLVKLQRGAKYFNVNAVESFTGFMPYRDQLQTCIPEMALDLIPNPVICNVCRQALRLAYDFKQKCLQVEDKIRKHVANQPLGDEYDLSALATFDQRRFDVLSYALKDKSEKKEIVESNEFVEIERKKLTDNVVQKVVLCKRMTEQASSERNEIVYENESHSPSPEPNCSMYENHKQSHDATVMYMCDYKACVKGYTSKTQLFAHKSEEHGSCSMYDNPIPLQEKGKAADVLYMCHFKFCLREFPTKAELISHKLEQHGSSPDPKCYRCNFCNNSFRTLQLLRQHNSQCKSNTKLPAVKTILTKRPHLPNMAKNHLKRWLFRHTEHPYPTDQEKQQLMKETDLTLLQVENWFINARRRILQDLTKLKAQWSNSDSALEMDTELDLEEISYLEREERIRNNGFKKYVRMISQPGFSPTENNLITHIKQENSNDHVIEVNMNAEAVPEIRCKQEVDDV